MFYLFGCYTILTDEKKMPIDRSIFLIKVATANRHANGKQSRGFSEQPPIVLDFNIWNNMHKHIINPIGNFLFFENVAPMSCLPHRERDCLPLA
jgi:hypothetical protein